MSLIFNEIIEINCFELSYNTKRNIANRAEIEEHILIINPEEHDNDAIENDEYLITLKNDEISKESQSRTTSEISKENQ